MNNDPVYQRLREIGWRQKLTKAEQAELQAWLAAHPEAAAEIEAETALNRALAALPDAPMPSNFTARVLQGVEQAERETVPQRRAHDSGWIWRVLVPRAAVAAVVIGAGGLAYQNHRAQQREVIGHSIETVLGVPTLPSPEILADFDVIQKLDSASSADQELIALLQ
jgi:hypothetical protein